MRTARFSAIRIEAALLASALLSGCSSSFFKITTENTGAPQAARPEAPAQKPLQQPSRDNTPRRQPAAPSTISPPAAARPDSAPSRARGDTLDTEPAAQASDSAGVERLVQLATVWSTIAHFHPWISTRGIAWDSVLVRTVPKVRAAKSNEDFQRALNELLAVLDDTVTRFVTSSPASEGARTLQITITPDSVLLIALPTGVAADDATQRELDVQLRQLAERAARFARVVIDVRGVSNAGLDVGSGGRAASVFDRSGLAASLTMQSHRYPEMRRRVVGALYTDSIPDTFAIGGAPGAWRVAPGGLVAGNAPQLTRPAPLQRGRNRQPQPPIPVTRSIVVVANEQTVWPLSLAALVASNTASLFAEGSASDAGNVPTTMLRVPSAGSLRVRLGELTGSNGAPAITPDTTFAVATTAAVAVDSTSPAVSAALRAVRAGVLPSRLPEFKARASLPPVFDTAVYPAMGARVLGVFRLWSAMRTLHANRDAYDDDIDEQLRKAIVLAESSTTPRDYARALIALTASSDDSGVRLSGGAFDEAVGLYALPIEARWVDGRALVTHVVNADGASGIAVGDEITAVNGFPMLSWLVETRRILPASNEWSRVAMQMEIMRRGAQGSSSILRVRDAKGAERTVTVVHSIPYTNSSTLRANAQEFTRVIDGGIRYINATAEGTSAAATLADARGVIVDLRGSVSDAGIAATRKLLSEIAHPVARVVRRGISAPCQSTSLRASQSECPDERSSTPILADNSGDEGAPNGLVAVLIDERTDPRGEFLALQLEVAGARLLGTATAGALSPVSWIQMPGNLRVSMPLAEVRRADGGQLHRVGLTPLVDIRPTVRGVRAGVDDVLERAVTWMQQELSPPARRRR